ncbi:ThuA domain-containing protein [Arenibacter latericius]|uniref:ThuA domain-containing protein n=1 Tax=Arenibacter latericius TaxID=86104 RepID=UPI00040442B5|nr:ThuA domain-containing protein [Arenibacter latericius]MDX1363309.1 ThuA domain-containing protein [Arenibacter latericius]
MKNYFYLLLTLLIVSCSGKKNKQEKSESTVEEAVEWLTFNGNDNNAKHIVFISGDEEYRSEEALTQMAKILSTHHGFKSTVLYAQNPEKPGIINANYGQNIPGLEALESADMMVIFTRFRALPDDQMQHIDNYLKTGKPVMGIRTSTHAFNFKPESNSNFKHYGNYYNGEKTEWKDGFGRFILGENWINHHGHHKHQSTRGIIADGAEGHPITNGLENGDVWGPTDVYGVRLPLPGDSEPIILGQVVNRAGEFDEKDIFFGMKPTDNEVAKTNDKGTDLNNPMMPVAWTKSYKLPDGKKGKVFTSTIGAANDLLIEGTRRLLVNGVFWAMDIPVPEKADVTLVGDYNPTTYEFRKDEYWDQKQLKVTDLK